MASRKSFSFSLGSKRKNQGGSSSQTPLDNTRFRSMAEQERYAYFDKKPVVVERNVHSEELYEVGIKGILRARDWDVPMRSMGGYAHRPIVREFYCNAQIMNNERRTLKIWVRSQSFVVDENLISRVLEVRRELNPIYPLANAENLTVCGRELTGNPDFVWAPNQKNIPQGLLTDKYKLLNLIAVANITPQCRHNQVFAKRIRLIHAIGTGVPMDLSSIILNEMILAVDDTTVRGALPFGKLVTELCRANLILFGCMDLIKGMAPIDGGTLKRSRSARPSEREEVGEEDEEEREEFLALEAPEMDEDTPDVGTSQRDDSSISAMLKKIMVEQKANHRITMLRLDQHEEMLETMMRRMPPPPEE